MSEEKRELNLFIPEDLTEYYITGGAIASSPFDIRLILFKDKLPHRVHQKEVQLCEHT